jgi:small-conductance mechanosensitive channel
MCRGTVMLASLQVLLDNYELILTIVATLIGAFVMINILNRLIGKLEKTGELEKGTLVHLRRFFQIIIYLVAAVIIISFFTDDITAAIAGLGVGALIVGFGLQDIIENWVSGLLLLSGKTYTIGDVIRVGDLTGTVTDIALRTTKMKTYDRNEIIIPNSVLMREKIINLTSGNKEAVSSITFAIDYTADVEKAKSIIETILKDHKSVIFNLKRKREIRFILRSQEWTNQLETLFWINDPPNEEFIKSNITELIQNEFKKEQILPPIPAIIRKEYLPRQNTKDEHQSE